MYGILIVDDESYFRKYLRTCVNWESYGFQICGEASNGKDALEIINSSNPDIVLADINMTGMNGIEFSSAVKQINPNIPIIIITGFNEFAYAKQAINIGVSNFISKPFKKEELIESVLKVKESLRDLDNRQMLMNSLKKKYADTALVAQSATLYKLLTGGFDQDFDKAKSEIEKYGIQLPEFPAAVIIIESELIKNAPDEVEKTVNQTFGCGKRSNCLAIVHENWMIGIISLLNREDAGYLKSCCCKVVSEMTRTYGDPVSIGVGTMCPSEYELSESFEKARIALKNKFLLGNNNVILYQALKIDGSTEEMYPFGLKNDLLMYARLLDGDKVNDTITHIYNSIHEHPVQIDFVYILYTELLSNCFSFLAEYGYSMREVFGSDFLPFEELLKGRTIQEVNEFVKSVYNKVIVFLKSRKTIHSEGMVKKAKEFIDKNYVKKNLTIDDIAAKVFFHPSYLRFIFKKEMNMTINEYITSVRMEKAKELICKGRFSNSVVAEMVGYSDATYFSKCFKKYYKMNPSEFEKKLNER